MRVVIAEDHVVARLLGRRRRTSPLVALTPAARLTAAGRLILPEAPRRA